MKSSKGLLLLAGIAGAWNALADIHLILQPYKEDNRKVTIISEMLPRTKAKPETTELSGKDAQFSKTIKAASNKTVELAIEGFVPGKVLNSECATTQNVRSPGTYEIFLEGAHGFSKTCTLRVKSLSDPTKPLE